MKKLLAVMLSLVMVMSLFTGCGSSSDKNAEAKKESSTFFKELKKVAEIDKGTVSLEYNINLKGDEITNSTDIPAVMKSGDTIPLALKADIVTESKDKVAAKISVKYGEQMDYTELTTIAVSGSKLYLNVGSLVEFAKSIDEEAAKQIEAALPQMGVTNDYASVDVDQFLKAAGVDETATTGNSDKLVAAVKAMMENMEKSFDKLQGQDGDDYTLTIGADNAEQVVDSIYNYIDGGFKTDVTAVIDGLAEALGNDSELASSFDEAKEENRRLASGWLECFDACDETASAGTYEGVHFHWLMSEVSQGEISSIASSGGEEGSTPNAGPTSSASGEDSYVNSGCKQDAEATYNKFIALKYSYTYQEDTARNGYILHDLYNDDLPIEVITTDSSENGANSFFANEYSNHIQINEDYHDEAEIKRLVMACPANLYHYDDGKLVFSHEGCLECGTCRVISGGKGVKSWKHPKGAMGVEFHQG